MTFYSIYHADALSVIIQMDRWPINYPRCIPHTAHRTDNTTYNGHFYYCHYFCFSYEYIFVVVGGGGIGVGGITAILYSDWTGTRDTG